MADETTWAQPEAHLTLAAKIGPVIDDRFRAGFLHCAEECAHSVVTICVTGIVKPTGFQGISGKATVSNR